jgi:hypothetical protein
MPIPSVAASGRGDKARNKSNMIASRVRDDVLNRRINAGAAGTLDIDDRGLVCLANGNVGLDMLKLRR